MFPFSQFFPERIRISGIAKRNYAHRFPSLRDCELFSRGVGVKPGHLVRGKTESCRLQGQAGSRLAQIVEAPTIGSPVLRELSMRQGQDQHRRFVRPASVKVYQHTHHGFIIFRVSLCGHKKCPGLLVTRGRSPARGFEHAEQFAGFDETVRECARAPSPANQFVNRSFCLS